MNASDATATVAVYLIVLPLLAVVLMRQRGMSLPGVLVAAALSALCEAVAIASGITDNLLWAPDTRLRAAALAVTITPVAALAVAFASGVADRRHREQKGVGGHG